MRAFTILSASLCVLALISFGVAAPAPSSYEDGKSPKPIECHEGKRYYKDEYGKTEECYKYKYDPKKDLHRESYKPEECHKGKRYYKGEDGKTEECYKYKDDPKKDLHHESYKPEECHKGKRYYKGEDGKMGDCYKYDPKENFLRKSPEPKECHNGKRYYKRDGKIEECRKYKHDSKKHSLRVRDGSSFNNTVPSVIDNEEGYSQSEVYQQGAYGSYQHNQSGIPQVGDYVGSNHGNVSGDEAESIQWRNITIKPTESTSPEVTPDGGEDLTAVLPTTALLGRLL